MPAKQKYVELQVTSNFSFLRGASHPEELVSAAAQLGYRALALTDRNTLAGIVRAHTVAKEHKLQFIVGCALELSSSSRILLYPTSRQSYSSLSKLLTLGKRRAEKGECLLELEDLLEVAQGLHAVVVARSMNADALDKTLSTLLLGFKRPWLSVAISRLYEPGEERKNAEAVSIARRYGVAVVATNDVHFHSVRRRAVQDTLTCIRAGCTIDAAGLRLFRNRERYLKPPSEIERLFANYPYCSEAIHRTQEIAEAANGFSLDEIHYEYPREICPPGKTPFEYLIKLTQAGARWRYPEGVPAEVTKQLEYEYALIEELDYSKYFLTVYDIVSFARKRGILCQGRGAAANSAVCYCLGITAVNPAQINILFERFISKERNEPPDIDIDFEHERREEVIQYIYSTYGRERAALVCEVITYRRRSALRDVGKVFGLSSECIEALVKADGINPTDRTIKNVISISNVLSRFPRHLSQHVGGFVITEKPLSEIVPIENARMPNRTVIEWDKDDIDAMGMLKIDILGLGMLTCIRKAFEMVNVRSEDKLTESLLQLHSIPAEDPSVYQMISKADTIGVFQIESRAQMSMLPRLRPRCYYDLVIEVAIVRPGPIQGKMVHPYIRRRSGQEPVRYPSQEIKRILKRTLGVPLFQEQVMELSMVGAGFSAGEADELRRAMASWKRKGNLLAQFEKRIISGMLKKGYSREFALGYCEQIKGFSEYGFPESHAASFALLVYVSAWLKKHHSAAFTASLLNSQPMGFYQPAQLIQDAKNHDVTVLPVDVNHSAWDSTLEDDSTLRLGMRLVRGLSAEQAEQIHQAVKIHGTFSSISDLWRKSAVRVHTLKKLAMADCFTSLGCSRQSALWEIKKFRDEPLPLLEAINTKEPPASLPTIALPQQVLDDYYMTGLSLKAHPVSFIRKQLSRHNVLSAAEIKNEKLFPTGKKVLFAGLVLVRQRPLTASGVVFLTLEDETGTLNLIVRPRVFEKYKPELKYASCLLIGGHVERTNEVIHVLVHQARDITDNIYGFESASRDFH